MRIHGNWSFIGTCRIQEFRLSVGNEGMEKSRNYYKGLGSRSRGLVIQKMEATTFLGVHMGYCSYRRDPTSPCLGKTISLVVPMVSAR